MKPALLWYVLILFVHAHAASRDTARGDIRRRRHAATRIRYFADDTDELYALRHDEAHLRDEPSSSRVLVMHYIVASIQAALNVSYDRTVALLGNVSKDASVDTRLVERAIERYVVSALRAAMELSAGHEVAEAEVMSSVARLKDNGLSSSSPPSLGYSVDFGQIVSASSQGVCSSILESLSRHLDPSSADGAQLLGVAMVDFDIVPNGQQWDFSIVLSVGSNGSHTASTRVIYYNDWMFMGYELLPLTSSRQRIALFYAPLRKEDEFNRVEYSYLEPGRVYHLHSLHEKDAAGRDVFSGYFSDDMNDKRILVGSFTDSVEDTATAWGAFIEMDGIAVPTCCHVPAVDIFLSCPYGPAVVQCSGLQVSEFAYACSQRYSNLVTQNAQLEVDGLPVSGAFVHRGWVYDAP